MTRYIKFGFILLGLLAPGILFFVDNPPENFTRVRCVVLSYTPSSISSMPVGKYTTFQTTEAKARVQMLDTSEVVDAKGVIGECRIGEVATASARIGRLTGKLISVEWITCSEGWKLW